MFRILAENNLFRGDRISSLQSMLRFFILFQNTFLLAHFQRIQFDMCLYTLLKTSNHGGIVLRFQIHTGLCMDW